ncbi:hypothetical protein OYC64_005817 [Pagothenia borchgrevinki]|uniref:Meiosis-specific coiled-coil domain-containing protein MEIOC n=1 Tax=Pagothenia borchgrevinki TaxID=8213 RepID=A0ABD2GHZ6_PAGBO
MAFDGHQSRFPNSLFPSNQHQASFNTGGGENGREALPFVSPQDQKTAVDMPWSHNAFDPYSLISCAQNSRKPSNTPDYDGETDLLGLVSNIVDEEDSQDSYFSEGSLPTCNPVWSPKTLSEELLQYVQSEGKAQQHSTFLSNYVSREALDKAQGQSVGKDVEEIYQQSNGHSTNQQWLFNLPNGDRNSTVPRPQKLPPGLSIPNTGNTYPSQVQQSGYDDMPAEKNRGNSQPSNNLSDLSNVFRPQSEMNSSYFTPYYEKQFTQSSTKPISNEQYGTQDINQLVSSFRSLMAGEPGSLCRGDFTNIHRQSVGMQHEDSVAEQWKISGPAMSTQSHPAMQSQKQLVGAFGTQQIEINGEVRKQTFERDAFQDPPRFSPQNAEYYLQNQSNMTLHRENTSLPFNMSMNQYSKHHFQQGLIQNKPQMQREENRMHMPHFLGKGFSTNTNMRGGDRKQVLSHNLSLDHLGSMQSRRTNGENGMVSGGNTQQLRPPMYPVHDPRRYSSVPMNASHFSPKSTLPYGSGVTAMNVGDRMSASESAVFNSYISDMMTCRGENTYHGMASALTPSMVMNQGGPVTQLYVYVDECYEQWRSLERDRKRTEVILTKAFLGKRTAAVVSPNLPKTPPNPTRIDHLIVNQMREQARVASLLDRMEFLGNTALHMDIHTALSRHHMAICNTQARHKEEPASKHQRQRAHFTEDTDTLLMVNALKDLAAATRKIRTALWCAVQLTLPKTVKSPEPEVNKQETHRERGPSPFEGYSFKL